MLLAVGLQVAERKETLHRGPRRHIRTFSAQASKKPVCLLHVSPTRQTCPSRWQRTAQKPAPMPTPSSSRLKRSCARWPVWRPCVATQRLSRGPSRPRRRPRRSDCAIHLRLPFRLLLGYLRRAHRPRDVHDATPPPPLADACYTPRVGRVVVSKSGYDCGALMTDYPTASTCVTASCRAQCMNDRQEDGKKQKSPAKV